MARFKFVENELKELVTKITNLQENNSYFISCLNFSINNIKNHNYSDINESSIIKIKEGIIEKLQIHNLIETSKKLDNSINHFLSFIGNDTQDIEKIKSYYSILHLLLLISQSPTEITYKYSNQINEKIKREDSFNWKEYLLDSDDEYNSLDYFKDKNSDEDDNYSLDSNELKTKIGKFIKGEEENEKIKHQNKISSISKNIVLNFSNDYVFDYCSLILKEKCIFPYWKDMSYSSQDLEKIEACKHFILFREVIWLLNGYEDLILFILKDGIYQVNTDSALTISKEIAMSNQLKELAYYGTCIKELKFFIANQSDIMECNNNNIIDDGLIFCKSQTFQAFAESMSVFFKKFSEMLFNLERKIMLQNDHITFLSLLQCIEPSLKQLKLLKHLYDSILYFKKSNLQLSLADQTYSFIDRVYNILNDSEFSKDQIMIDIIYLVWSKLSQPYIQIIDSCLKSSYFKDPFKEFIISNSDYNDLCEQFWCTEIFSNIRSQKKKRFLDDILAKIFKTNICLKFLQSQSLNTESVISKSTTNLADFLCQNKSYSFLNISFESPMSDIKQVSDPFFSNYLAENLKQKDFLLVACFKNNLNITDNIKKNNNNGINISENTISNMKNYDIHNYNNITMDSINSDETNINDNINIIEHFSNSSQISDKLKQYVEDRYSAVSSNLLKVLNQEFKLSQHFLTLRRYFLLEDGFTMFEFHTKVFDKLNQRENFSEETLNSYLHEALNGNNTGDIDRLYITLNDINPESMKELALLESINLNYLLPDPCSLIIRQKDVLVYNSIFQFLLQINCAKYSLDQLKFKSLKIVGSNKSSSIDSDQHENFKSYEHKIYLLRMSLLHFINVFHNYIRITVIYSLTLEVEKRINKSAEFDEVISVYRWFLKTLTERCLLHKKVKFIKDMVKKVLQLALDLHHYWMGDHINDNDGFNQMDRITAIEMEYKRCLSFLTSMIRQVITRGAFFHLESLDFSILSCNPLK